MSYYPEFIDWDFSPVFRTLKEAKEIAIKNNTKPLKVTNGYLVKYKGKISNLTTTGREYYVVDNNGELHRKVITLIKSHPYEGTYKIEGFDGIYVCRSNWDVDIYVNCSFDGSNSVNELIKELSKKGRAEYITHMEICKPSKHLFNDLGKSDWQKAKENNYI